MKQYLFLISAFLLSLFLNAQEKVKVLYTGDPITNSYNFEKFKFTHQIFADAFFRTSLHKDLTSTEMAEIVETVRQRISESNFIKFEINLENSPKATLIFSIEPKTKDGAILIMTTNFDSETKKYGTNNDNNFVRYYFIKGNKIVYWKDLFSSEKETNLIKENNKSDLIELYMNDEVSENDAKIKTLIEEIINNSNSTKIENLYAKLYLQEYYLLTDKFELASKTQEDLQKYFEEYSNSEIPSNYSIISKMAKCELEIMNMIN